MRGMQLAHYVSLDRMIQTTLGLMDKMVPEILLIEKDGSLRAALAQHLRQEGFGVHATDRTEKVGTLLSTGSVQLVLLGLDELKRNGIALLRMIREGFPRVKVITINSGHQLDLSIEAMRLGVLDDFLIPFDIEELMACIRNARPGIGGPKRTDSY